MSRQTSVLNHDQANACIVVTDLPHGTGQSNQAKMYCKKQNPSGYPRIFCHLSCQNRNKASVKTSYCRE